MPIDTSIYQNLKPVEMPSILDTRTKVANLSGLALQQAHAAKQMEREDKDQSLQDMDRQKAAFGNALITMKSMSPEQRAQSWSEIREDLKAQGVPESKLIENHNEDYFNQKWKAFSQSPEYQAYRFKESEINKNASEATKNNAWGQLGAKRIDQAGRRLGILDEKLGLQKDNQASAAAGSLDRDPLLQSTQRQLNQMDVDKHTIQSADVITPQMLHEISGGIASALNQGRSVGLGQMQMQDLSTSQTQLASLMQQLTNSPQEGASPEIKKQMIDTLDRLKEAYQKVQANRAKQIAQGRNYSHSPDAKKALDQKVQSYQPVAQPDEHDLKALEWLETADPSSPEAFEIQAELRRKGLINE
jgi:hypothetical protein